MSTYVKSKNLLINEMMMETSKGNFMHVDKRLIYVACLTY